jgi:hypothetical protein
LSNAAKRRQRRLPPPNCPVHPFRFRARTSRISLSCHGPFGLPHRTPSHSRESGVVTLLISGRTLPKTSSIQRHMTPRAASLGEKAVREPSRPIPARPPRPPPCPAPTLGWLFCREVGKITPQSISSSGCRGVRVPWSECHGPRTCSRIRSQMSLCQTTDGIPPNGSVAQRHVSQHGNPIRLGRRHG